MPPRGCRQHCLVVRLGLGSPAALAEPKAPAEGRWAAERRTDRQSQSKEDRQRQFLPWAQVVPAESRRMNWAVLPSGPPQGLEIQRGLRLPTGRTRQRQQRQTRAPMVRQS